MVNMNHGEAIERERGLNHSLPRWWSSPHTDPRAEMDLERCSQSGRRRASEEGAILALNMTIWIDFNGSDVSAVSGAAKSPPVIFLSTYN